jgi:hypothetical protein
MALQSRTAGASVTRGTVIQVSAIYEPMLPYGWVGPRPDDYLAVREEGAKVPASWREVVVKWTLQCGIRVSAERCGLTVYDFAAWPPGASPRRKAFRTVAEASKEDSPIRDRRLSVMNAHQILMHSAVMVQKDESPPVAVIDDDDLLDWDIDEQTGEGFWRSSRHGAVGYVITAADRERVDWIQTDTFELSLSRLDVVVQAEQLDEFARLGQVRASVAGRDHSRAVIDGWVLCETRCNTLHPNPPKSVQRCITELEADGILDAVTASRLQELREVRNDFLHRGAAPKRDAAQKVLALATSMLRDTVPDLTTRVVDGWRL